MFASKEQFINTFKIIILIMIGMPMVCAEETTAEAAKTEGGGFFQPLTNFLTKPLTAYIMFFLSIVLILGLIIMFVFSARKGDDN